MKAINQQVLNKNHVKLFFLMLKNMIYAVKKLKFFFKSANWLLMCYENNETYLRSFCPFASEIVLHGDDAMFYKP